MGADGTRHNVGFDAVDAVAAALAGGRPGAEEPRPRWELAEGRPWADAHGGSLLTLRPCQGAEGDGLAEVLRMLRCISYDSFGFLRSPPISARSPLRFPLPFPRFPFPRSPVSVSVLLFVGLLGGPRRHRWLRIEPLWSERTHGESGE
ncbi:unnamed protein product [Prorocentrum cordatum]|uniref:Uncharacterized protein n=1 Tax=Prorocentrum cordatum TaxID=2364126 RepID=A0ABN9TA05_9DINO|nr:unnamed protein product [Polarella glacialis]